MFDGSDLPTAAYTAHFLARLQAIDNESGKIPAVDKANATQRFWQLSVLSKME
jgi:ABC-type sugar transport system permease subunit